MGRFEDYRASVARRLDRSVGTTMEDRVGAACDADDASRLARQRLEGFVAAYLASWAEDQAVADECRAQDREEQALFIERRIQQVAATAGGPILGRSETLLFDDLRILLDLLEQKGGYRA